MNKWQLALCCVVFVCSSSEHMREKHMHLLPGRNMLNIIPDALGQTTNQSITSPDVSSKIPVTLSSLQKGIKIPVGISSLQKETSNKQVTLSSSQKRTSEIPVTLSSSLEPSKIGSVTEIALDVQEQKISDTSNMKVIPQVENKNKFGPTTRPFFDLTSLHPRPGLHHPVKHAGLPRGLQVLPMPLKDSDHELVFNVSWSPPDGPGVGFTREYSVVVNSINKTPDCDTPMCYECCLPGNQTWAVVPSITHPVAETCAIKPGCTYKVTLTAHPWDGHTAANMVVELDECVAGVCSCAHAVRLPAPVVSAKTISVQGDLFVNVTWSLPAIPRNIRLPRDLEKKFYYIRLLFPTSHFFVLSVGKQMVSDAHPSPWFGRGTSRKVDAIGKVSSGDQPKWFMLPINDKKDDKQITVTPDVKLLARVNLIDERGCVGPAGSATAHDPTEQQHTTSFSVYALWATLGGFIFIATAAVVVVSAGAAKKVLRALRPSPVSAPLEPLRMGNAWFALQLHTNNENPSRRQVEQSPLYTHKVFEPPDEAADEWEIHRSRINLGALIGSGAFGRVHAAQLHMPAGETITVAAKMLNENATNEEMQDFLGEINMLKHVGFHKHVIRLIGCCTLKPPLIALLEHAPRGDLLSLLRSARGKRKAEVQDSNVMRRANSEINGRPSEAESEYTNLSDSDPALAEEKLYLDDYKRNKDHYVAEPALHLGGSTMREYALQVALGMRHLEERGITHRDLAARNILVDGAGLLKVADFGLSRSGIYVHTKAKPVPLRWLAPEAIVLSQYSGKSDVWAFAVLLWEIATLGGFPYAELSNHEVPAFLTTGKRLPKPVRASPRLYDLMIECWAEEPQQRPTFAQIVDKLIAQKQLYVDLETLDSFQDDVTVGLSDYDFSMSSEDWPNIR